MLPLDLVLHLANTKLRDRRSTGAGVANCVRIGRTYRKKLSFFNLPLQLDPEEDFSWGWVRELDIRRTNKTMVIMRYGYENWIRTTLRICGLGLLTTHYSGTAHEDPSEFRLGSYDHGIPTIPQVVTYPLPVIVY